jgi:hypothetical protein
MKQAVIGESPTRFAKAAFDHDRAHEPKTMEVYMVEIARQWSSGCCSQTTQVVSEPLKLPTLLLRSINDYRKPVKFFHEEVGLQQLMRPAGYFSFHLTERLLGLAGTTGGRRS